MLHAPDTIAALATPVGRSALAILRASGSDTARLAREICGEIPPPRSVRRADYRNRAGTLIDDVLLTFFAGPNSYTGEDSLEIYCHGNPFIAQRILEDLLARGCRAANPGEFTQRAFLNGQMDLSQAEAVMDLIHARSERALAAANQQLRGSLGRHMHGLTTRLLGVLARVEAQIDFPEEDIPPQDGTWLANELAQIIEGTEQLLATSRYGELLREGIRTVIVGAPNAGKSTLLNSLVGYERALVSEEPGTTRDFIEEQIVVGPHCLRLVDTAGLNPFPAPLEKRGVDKTLERTADADLVVVVIDATQPVPTFPTLLTTRIAVAPTVLVLNKQDLESSHQDVPVPFPVQMVVRTSALTGAGVADLCVALGTLADSFQKDVGGEIIAINARHADALSQAQECLKFAREKFRIDAPLELIASDLRDVLNAFGRLTGKIDDELMLDRLFATFCIGK